MTVHCATDTAPSVRRRAAAAPLAVWLAALAGFYLLTVGLGPPLARYAGALTLRQGPPAAALAVALWTADHRLLTAVALLAAAAMGVAAACGCRHSRRALAVGAVAAIGCDAVFAAVLLLQFFLVPAPAPPMP